VFDARDKLHPGVLPNSATRANERQGTAQHRTIDVGRGDNISTARTGCAPHDSMGSAEDKNYAAILRLEQLLEELRVNPSTAREPEAIREIGLEIAVAIREVGAMLINVGWEQTFATTEESRARDREQDG